MSAILSLVSAQDLAFFDFLRQLAKLLGLFVTGLCLELRELPRFLTGEERNQGFKFGCRLLGMVASFSIKCSNFRTASL